MDTSANLNLPYLLPSQAQKHVTVNEALRRLDALVQIGLTSRSLTSPPGVPADGERYIPADGADGDWEGHGGHIAAFQDGSWAFFTPQEGWLAFIADENLLLVWREGDWHDVVAPALNPAGMIGINATADTVNRLAVSSAASMFGHAGAGHQLKLNKAGTGETASCLFQSDYSGRAEIGLVGSDDLTFKLSPDGASFASSLTLKSDTGFAGFGTDAPVSRIHVQQEHDARLTIDTVNAASGGGFDILNSTNGQNWRVTGSPTNFKVRDHTAGLDKIQFYPGAAGTGSIINTPRFGIGTSSPTAQLHVEGAVRIGASAKASLPDAAGTGAGALLLVTDESGGAVLAFSDGTHWRRVTDRAVVS